jgi:hypothetical protein
MSVLMNRAVGRNINDLYELSSGPLAGTPRWDGVRIAGDPNRIQPKVVGHICQKAQSSRGVGVTSMFRLDEVADVTGIPLDVYSTTNPQVDGTEFLSRTAVQHTEEVRLALVDRMGLHRSQLKLQITIAEHGETLCRCHP